VHRAALFKRYSSQRSYRRGAFAGHPEIAVGSAKLRKWRARIATALVLRAVPIYVRRAASVKSRFRNVNPNLLAPRRADDHFSRAQRPSKSDRHRLLELESLA
jgi:hypothetical protein